MPQLVHVGRLMGGQRSHGVPHIPVEYYLDPGAGSDGANGLTSGTAWASTANFALLKPHDTVHLKSGGTLTAPLLIPCAGLTFDLYGGASKFTINLLTSIKGVAGDWTEVSSADGSTPTPGSKLWRRELAANGGFMLNLVFDRAADGLSWMAGFETGHQQWYETSLTNINAFGRWRYLWNSLIDTFTVWLYADVNPGGDAHTYEVNGQVEGFNAGGLPVTVTGVHLKGSPSGFIHGPSSAFTDCSVQFCCQRAFVGNAPAGASSFTYTRPRFYDIGRTARDQQGGGDHGFRWLGAGDAFVTFTITDWKADNCKEDLIQPQDTLGSCNGTIVTTAPGETWLTQRGGENVVDWKCPGGITFDNGGAYLEGGTGAGPTTIQIAANKLKLSNAIINQPNTGFTAINIAETDAYFETDHCGIYAANASTISVRFTGQTCKSAFDIVVCDFNNTCRAYSHATGKLNLLHSTAIILTHTGTTGSAMDMTSSSLAGQVTAITLVSTAANGDRTYALENGTSSNHFGAGLLISITSLTGASAALNGVWTVTRTYQRSSDSVYVGEIVVPFASSPPATVDKTGMGMQGIGILNRQDNGLFIGVGDTFRTAAFTQSTPNVIGAACVNDMVTAERLVQFGTGGTRYTTATMKSMTQSVGNLNFDSGAKLNNGNNWKGNYTSSYTKRWVEKAVTSVTVAGEIATVVCTGHGYSTGRRIALYGVTAPVTCNGFHRITVSDANTFTFQVRRGTTDQVATGTIAALDGTLLAGSDGLNTAPVVSLDGYTTDFHGAAVNVVNPSFGAVM